MKADLHIHTAHSDGVFTFTEFKEKLNKWNIKEATIAIADHNYLTHQTAFFDGHILFIPAIEISSQLNNFDTCHILGYSSKPKLSKTLKTLLKKVNLIYKERGKKIYKKLIQAGYKLPPLNKIRKIKPSQPVYVYDLVGYLKKYFKRNKDDEILKWGKDNGLFYIKEKNTFPHVSNVIKALRESNFIVSWAHPGTRFLKNNDINDIEVFRKTLNELIEYGLNGIEVFFPKHNKKQISHFLKMCDRNDLLVTGGSDFHGNNRGGIIKPKLILQEAYLRRFLKAIGL